MSERFERQMERWVGSRPGRVAVILAGVGEREVWRRAWSNDARIHSLFERRFAVASVTKPIVAMALLKLVEWGECRLDEPVRRFWPDFAGGGKERVALLHLVTHTSGLPRALPDNEAWRRAHASLDEVARRLAAVELEAEPGRRVRYSSPGFLAVQKVVEAVTGQPLPDFVRREILMPVGAATATLGLDELEPGETPDDDVVPVLLTPEQEATDYHWNSRYWKRLAAPWAGLYARAGDLAALLRAILRGLAGGAGRAEPGCETPGRGREFSPATLCTMVSDHTTATVQESAPPGVEAWGLGWRLNRGTGAGELFGDLLSGRAFGHMGATGVSCGADPESGLWWVLLSNDPAAEVWLGRAVNVLKILST